MMKPEPSELVLRGGCISPRSPPLGAAPPRRFLKKSSKNSSNGEPGGNCGIASLPPPPLASTLCEVEILTTESITFSAMSAMPSGPRALAGTEASKLATLSEIAIPIRRRRLVPVPFRLNRNGVPDFCFDAFSSREPVATSLENALVKAGLAPVMSACLQRVEFGPQCARTGPRRKHLRLIFRRKTGPGRLTIALTPQLVAVVAVIPGHAKREPGISRFSGAQLRTVVHASRAPE